MRTEIRTLLVTLLLGCGSPLGLAESEVLSTPPLPSGDAEDPSEDSVSPPLEALTLTALSFSELASKAEARLSHDYLNSFAKGEPQVWEAYQQLEALLSLFEATGETRFLDRFVAEADEMLAARDDRHERRDAVRGRVMPSWSTLKYCERSVRHAWAVHGGILAAPLVRFASLARAPAAQQAYEAKAQRYLKAASETLDAFRGDFQFDGTSGFYEYPARIGVCKAGYQGRGGTPLPINMTTAVATGEARLVALGADPEGVRSKRVRGVANRVNDAVKSRGDGAIWGYYAGQETARVEDTSHGGLTAVFAVAAANVGLVRAPFLRRLGATVDTFMGGSPVVSSEGIDGSGKKSASLNHVCGRWLELAPASPKVFSLCLKGASGNVLHLAQLARMKSLLGK